MKKANSPKETRRPAGGKPAAGRFAFPDGNILGLGIDHAEPARLKNAIRKHGDRFLERIFTPREIAYCRRFKLRPEERFAARWAAKEAAAKALGLGIADGIRWTEIEVVNAKNGSPSLRVTGRAATLAKKAGIRRWLISVTHTESLATAIALALP